eukprot:TRINITY_DN10069_c0_g1_i1.p1 TRINITY_DN10069_c0_g1~~TRINITY_DN10069_c0_g1_i1.p1  ORF type:complete len:432 (-),score=39.60 TRINITY_DN10069_c0_g1_i1:14-1309(-)
MKGYGHSDGGDDRTPPSSYPDLIAGLPDDLALLCLGRVPVHQLPPLAQVCTTWRALLLSSPSVLWKQRKALGMQVQTLTMLCIERQSKVDTSIVSPSRKVLSLALFDSTEKTWLSRPVPTSVEGLLHCGAVALENFVYFFGGRVYAEEGFGYEFSQRLWRYNVYSDSWKRLADMAKPRGEYQYGLVEGGIVVVGGVQAWHLPLLERSYEVYEPEDDTWSLVEVARDWAVDASGYALAFSVRQCLYLHPQGIRLSPREQTSARMGDRQVVGDEWMQSMAKGPDDPLGFAMGRVIVSVAIHRGCLFAVELVSFEVSKLLVFSRKWKETEVIIHNWTNGPQFQGFELVAVEGGGLYLVGSGFFVGEVKSKSTRGGELDVTLETIVGGLKGEEGEATEGRQGESEAHVSSSQSRWASLRSFHRTWRHSQHLGLLV